MTWRTVLEVLEARLARLAEGGALHLTVTPSAETARMLAEARVAAASPAVAIRAPAPPGEQLAIADPAAPGEGGKHPSELDTLEALHAEFQNCQRCGLARGRTSFVFGVGHPRPRLMFIGEGPGQEEDRQGLPFVGRAGQLLTAGIQALGLTRDDVYIANVVKCRPPGNRVPAPGEIAACAPILRRQIELLDPALIEVLGNVPLKALNPGARGITAERGRIFEHHQWRVFPTYHPAYLLRNPGALEQWWLDMKQAFRAAYGTEP